MRFVLFFVLVGCDAHNLYADDIGGSIYTVEQSESSSGTTGTPTPTESVGGTPVTTVTEAEGSDSTSTHGSSSGHEACYPGALEDWTTCLDTWGLSPVPADYAYPSALDARYLQPLRFLDLTLEDPALSLAPNFALSEIAQEWKGQWAVVQPHAVDHLQALRDQLGPVVVNSGYRSPDYNSSVGGATWSRHMYGDAFDMVATDHTLDALADECDAEGAAYVSIYVSHVHCDWRDDGLDAVFYGVALPLFGATEGPEQPGADLVPGVPWTAPTWGFDEGEPLRRWSAYDLDGLLLEQVDSTTYLPPAGAAEVQVEVAGHVVLSAFTGA